MNETKEQLIERLTDMLWGNECHVKLTAYNKANQIYDEISAHAKAFESPELVKARTAYYADDDKGLSEAHEVARQYIRELERRGER